MSVQFLKLNAFSTCSRRFLISNELDKLEFRLEKELGFRTTHTGYIKVFMQGKCGRDTGTTFLLKRRFGTYGN